MENIGARCPLYKIDLESNVNIHFYVMNTSIKLKGNSF